MTALSPQRTRTVEQMRLALAKAAAVQQVLRLAIDELETTTDDHIASNVVTFATNFTVRQAADISRAVTGMP